MGNPHIYVRYIFREWACHAAGTEWRWVEDVAKVAESRAALQRRTEEGRPKHAVRPGLLYGSEGLEVFPLISPSSISV